MDLPASNFASARDATIPRAEVPSRSPRFRLWREITIDTWRRSSKDNLGLIAAGVAFYSFLALVPLLAATVLTYGLVASPETVLRHVQALTAIMPAEAATLVGEQLLSVIATSSGKKGLGLLAALAIALFGARNAAGSIITALNIAYEREEQRGFVAVNLLALAITVGGILAGIVIMVTVAALGNLDHLLPALSGTLGVVGKILSFGLLLAGGAAGAATLYRFAPDHDAQWRWITPGTFLAASGWIILTWAFSLYAASLGNYDRTYGSLATVVVLLTWVYLSAYLLLVGAELNCAIERKCAATDASHATSNC